MLSFTSNMALRILCVIFSLFVAFVLFLCVLLGHRACSVIKLKLELAVKVNQDHDD